jgi:hypothetical protein
MKPHSPCGQEVAMRKALVLLVALAGLTGSSVLRAQQPAPSSVDLEEFLARHRDAVRPIQQVFDELTDQDLPLEDERGQPLTRRNIQDRRKSLRDLTATIDALALAPQDLVLTTRLFVQTETLTDDLFDLSQAAYDDDQEELGKRLHDLQTVIGRHRAWLESYLLSLAADRQARLVKLEKENAELKKKLAAH